MEGNASNASWRAVCGGCRDCVLWIRKLQEDDTRWVPFQARVVDRVDSILDPESYVKRKEEEAAKAAAKKAKPAKKEAKQ